jgi:hypothetical protein
MSLRSKWAAGKARGGRISKSIRNRRATQPPAHFQRNPLGPRPVGCFSALLARPVSIPIWALRSRVEKQPTDLRRRHYYMRDGALACPFAGGTASVPFHFSPCYGGQMISRTARRPSLPELSESGLPVPLEDETTSTRTSQNPRRKTKYEN